MSKENCHVWVDQELGTARIVANLLRFDAEYLSFNIGPMKVLTHEGPVSVSYQKYVPNEDTTIHIIIRKEARRWPSSVNDCQ